MLVNRVLIVLACGAGIVLRVRGMSVSLWMDEAWVANSLMAPSLREMFYYPTWLQTTPPGFLLLARETVNVFGLSPDVLRAVPLLSGIVGLVAFAVLATRVLQAPFSLIAVATSRSRRRPIWYGSTLKQYSTELMVGALVLIASWQFRRRPSARVLCAAPGHRGWRAGLRLRRDLRDWRHAVDDDRSRAAARGDQPAQADSLAGDVGGGRRGRARPSSTSGSTCPIRPPNCNVSGRRPQSDARTRACCSSCSATWSFFARHSPLSEPLISPVVLGGAIVVPSSVLPGPSSAATSGRMQSGSSAPACCRSWRC